MRPIRGAFFGDENGGCALTALCCAEMDPNEPLDTYVVDNWGAAKYGNAYVMGFIDAWDGKEKQPASRSGQERQYDLGYRDGRRAAIPFFGAMSNGQVQRKERGNDTPTA